MAWLPLGWQCVALAEIDPFCCMVLKHHYPDVANLGNLLGINGENRRGAADVLIGGTPCQSFSVAGRRKSLADERGNLSLRFVELYHAIKPKYAIWENVPGVLSTHDNAFGCFLAGIVGADSVIQPAMCGWTNAGVVAGPSGSAAWRIMDAQYFGLAQRRERLFVIASPGNGAHPAEILFEWESMRRDSPPRREAGEETTGTLSARTKGGGGLGTDFDCQGGIQVAHTLNAHGGTGRSDFESEPFIPVASGTLSHSAAGVPRPSTQGNALDFVVANSIGVRRLTPRECERLQGFPDDYTLVPYRGKPAKDGPRYKALGNSMAVPVIRWIGERVERALQ